MKKTKSYADLLREVFKQYSQKNKTGDEYDCWINSHDMCKAIQLSVFTTGSSDTPALILKQLGVDRNEVELVLTAKQPERGFNEDFSQKLFTVHSTFNSANELWGVPERSFGGMSHLMRFDESSYNKLIVGFLSKLIILIETGEYGPNPTTQ